MQSESTNYCCPLCQNVTTVLFHRDQRREYRQCSVCALVFVPTDYHLSHESERAEYDLHRNDLNDVGYRRFLSRLADPLATRLTSPSHGLDFGCGPGPLLAKLLESKGHMVAVYDPFYAQHPKTLEHSYDFITCTEVVEHFREPAREFELLFRCLKPSGILALMTKLVIDADAFSRWHYKNDPTHISYFSRPTLAWLAARYTCTLEWIDNDVMFLTRNDPTLSIPTVSPTHPG